MIEYVIAIDIGATNIRVGIVDNNCNIICVNKENTIKNDKQLLVEQIVKLINKLDYKQYNINNVGISACGIIENNIIKILPNLNITDFDLVSAIKKEFPNLNVLIANDANCTALSEAKFGAGKDYNSSFFITISSGVGGGLVINKELVNLPFEIGHLIFEYKGKNVHIENIISGNGLVRLCLDHSINISKAYEFFDLVRQDDVNALNVFDYWTTEVARLIVNNHLLFNVDCFILSGGVMKSSDLFIDVIENKANQMLKDFPLKKINIVLAKFDQDAGLIGAAATGFDLKI